MTPFLISFGYIGIFLIVFAETSVLVGFFLPGDSLLFAAGFLASLGHLSLPLLIFISFAAAVLGDSVGYAVGKRYGHKIFKREHSVFFHPERIRDAEEFYKKHGGKTIIIARFLPVIRTAAPILAGVGKMRYALFLVNNVVGALIWTFAMTLLGYYFGNIIPGGDRYAPHIIGIVLFFSLLVPIARVLLERRNK